VVSESLRQAKVRHVNKPAIDVTPADLLNSNHFDRIELAKREASKSAIMHALAELQPRWGTATKAGGTQELITAEQFEEIARSAAEGIMRRYSCFMRPYHFYHAIRQMTDVFKTNPQAATEVDFALSNTFRQHGRELLGGCVEPRSTIPGVIEHTPDVDEMLIYEARDEEEADEVERLHSEILAGRSWDEEEWERTTNELMQKHERAPLNSLLSTHFWLLGDRDRVEATYQWLAGEN
jgi:hypothetical protein